MEENEREAVMPSKTNFVFYDVPVEDALMGAEIIRQHGRNGAAAFRAILDNYGINRLLGELVIRLDTLEQRVNELEGSKKRVIETMGSHRYEIGGT